MRFLGFFCAIAVHVAILLFGKLLFPEVAASAAAPAAVELVAGAEENKPPPPKDEVKAADDAPVPPTDEPPPDASALLRTLESAPVNAAPALEAASLSAIEDALSGRGGGGGGDFAEALSFASGGRIGGTGKAGALDEKLEAAFSLTEIDQKPRPVFQAQPLFPAEMRGKKLDAVVTVIFVVDATGKVVDPKVEKSTHPAFEKPALNAVRQWRFEPAVRGGQRVRCRMRVGIRFPPN